ncbi:MAG: hypothetical protein J0H74_34915 [Chitinophagaceae bacterium]|nr:hypothetical protein [Chitinophagaceae bacterium]
MKRLNLFTFLSVAFILILIATGCKKDNNGGASAISATVGGTAWQSQYTTGSYKASNHYILLTGFYGKSGDTSSIELVISDTVHINEPDPIKSSSVEYYTPTASYASISFFGGHGVITVTSWDKNAHKLAGTFSGVLHSTQYNSKDSVIVENGRFNVSYTVL